MLRTALQHFGPIHFHQETVGLLIVIVNLSVNVVESRLLDGQVSFLAVQLEVVISTHPCGRSPDLEDAIGVSQAWIFVRGEVGDVGNEVGCHGAL